MEFDVFFSISQTPDSTGYCPDEQTMLANYLEQLEVADEAGYGVAWLAQAHLSTETQKMNEQPVIPHWEGEVGLCTDFFQLSQLSFHRTKRIEVGSAVLSILANGGPVATAERIGNSCALRAANGDDGDCTSASALGASSSWPPRTEWFRVTPSKRRRGPPCAARYSGRRPRSCCAS